MSKGYLMIAMGNDYVLQACLCAISIKKTQSINNVSIVTSDVVPERYKYLFDEIIEVPWHDKNARSFYVTEHRWKNFHVTPYDETVVLDTDMLFLNDVSHWWTYFSRKSIGFVTNVLNYRGRLVENNYYRKTFTANDLPNIYNAFHYFKKDDVALEYYKVLENICNNSKEFYKLCVPKLTPSKTSMDVNHAIAVTLTQIEDYKLDNATFTHMKSHVQDWQESSNNWTNDIPFYIYDDLKVSIGNYQQHGILHYTEHDFCKGALDVC